MVKLISHKNQQAVLSETQQNRTDESQRGSASCLVVDTTSKTLEYFKRCKENASKMLEDSAFNMLNDISYQG